MNFKDTLFSEKHTINCGGTIVDFSVPHVMGILNITPDSFFDGGRYLNEADIITKVAVMLSEGALIIDVGAYSSRPGAKEVPVAEEKSRLSFALSVIRKNFPDALLSVDTFRAGIASYVVGEYGVDIINDISSGLIDKEMISVVGALKVPYIMMHMQGTPETMQKNPVYKDVSRELLAFFAERIAIAKGAGIEDIIIDPGFGFGKSRDDNFRLLHELNLFGILGFPVMIGISRKSMIYKSLQSIPEEALNGTTVLNTLALNNGAKLLRVHDVREATEAIRLYSIYCNAVK